MREKQRLDILSSNLLEHVRMVEATATDHPHSLPLPVTKTEFGSEKASPIHSTGNRGYIVYKNPSGLACRNVVSYRLLSRPDMGRMDYGRVEQFGLWRLPILKGSDEGGGFPMSRGKPRLLSDPLDGANVGVRTRDRL